MDNHTRMGHRSMAYLVAGSNTDFRDDRSSSFSTPHFKCYYSFTLCLGMLVSYVYPPIHLEKSRKSLHMFLHKR